jgi:hypothetical protein
MVLSLLYLGFGGQHNKARVWPVKWCAEIAKPVSTKPGVNKSDPQTNPANDLLCTATEVRMNFIILKDCNNERLVAHKPTVFTIWPCTKTVCQPLRSYPYGFFPVAGPQEKLTLSNTPHSEAPEWNRLSCVNWINSSPEGSLAEHTGHKTWV